MIRLPARGGLAIMQAAAPIASSERVPVAAKRFLVDVAAHLTFDRPRCVRDTIGGITGSWVTPRSTDQTQRTLLHVHGGGFVLGSSLSHRNLAAGIARGVDARAFVPDYRRAPEHPPPAALHDVLATYNGLLALGVDPAGLLVTGDSAGGGLALSLALHLRDHGLPTPAAIGLICPWLDLSVDLEGRRTTADRDPVLTAHQLRSMAQSYVGRSDAKDPSVSPLLGDLSGLPPLVVHTSSRDTLRPDAERLVALGRTGAVDVVRHRIYDDMWHVFQLQAGLLGRADKALADLSSDLIGALALKAPAGEHP